MQDISGSTRERFEKTIRRKDKLAGFLYDIAKTIFASVVVANALLIYTEGMSFKVIMTIVLGILATIIFAWFANNLYKY